MRELKKEFIGRGQVRGFLFSQQKKSDYAYIYAVDTGVSTHFEVFKRKENSRFDCVSYPSNNAFGKWAKTTSDYDTALYYFDEYTLLGEEGQDD